MQGTLIPATLAELIRSRTLCFVLVALLVVPAVAVVGCDDSDAEEDDNGAVADPGDSEEEEEEEEEEGEEEEGKKPKPTPKPDPDARALGSMSTQVNCDISTFFLHITDLELQRESGGFVDILDAPMRVDLARLDSRLKEQMVAISDVPSGNYIGARITVDMDQSLAVILNHEQLAKTITDPEAEPGNQEEATFVSPDGEELTGLRTISVEVHGDSLMVEAGQTGHVRLIANLAAGAVADAEENELEWTPVFEAEFDPPRLRSMFAQGFLLDSSVINHQFTMGLMTATEDVGPITDVHVNESTVYQLAHGNFGVQPIVEEGVDGLKELNDLPSGTPLLVDLRVYKNDGLLADCVNAGLGVEITEGEDASPFAYGVIVRENHAPAVEERPLHAFVAFTPEHGYRFNVRLDVDVEAGYVPFLLECEQRVRGEEWLLLRQTVVLFGKIKTEKNWKKKKKVEYTEIKLSNKHCKEIKALARVLPTLYCGEHMPNEGHTFDLKKETFEMRVCSVGCLSIEYVVQEKVIPENWIFDVHVHAPGVDLCECCFDKKKKNNNEYYERKPCCICFYGFRLPDEAELKLPLYGNWKVRFGNTYKYLSHFALEVICPEDELEVQYPRNRKCVTITLVNPCEIMLNLLDADKAEVQPCSTCDEEIDLINKYNPHSHLVLWAVQNAKYFSIFDFDHVDQYHDAIEFTDELEKRVKLGDRNIYRAWASGEYTPMATSIVFFGNHIVVILQEKIGDPTPTK